MRSCCKEPEAILHHLLRCDLYSIYRIKLFNDICALNESLTNPLEENLMKVLLHQAEDFTFHMNSEILKCTKTFIKTTRRS